MMLWWWKRVYWQRFKQKWRIYLSTNLTVNNGLTMKKILNSTNLKRNQQRLTPDFMKRKRRNRQNNVISKTTRTKFRNLKKSTLARNMILLVKTKSIQEKREVIKKTKRVMILSMSVTIILSKYSLIESLLLVGIFKGTILKNQTVLIKRPQILMKIWIWGWKENLRPTLKKLNSRWT